MSINAQPFNPTFKLIGNLVEDQVLTYDSSENAFVNSTNTGGTAGSGFDAAVNTGTGLGVWSGTAGTTLQFKTLIGGTDITIVDNGDALVINSTLTETLQTGTNMGTGTGIYDSKDATTHQLKFKSLAVGTGLTLTDDGAGTLTLVNTIGAGTTDADLTLSNLSDNATARTNLGVYSKIESDALYHKHDDAFVPSVNNTYDIGSSTLKYNDIYAETFQGTAVLADNLTTSGTTGQVLTYNGSHWVAADTSGGTLLGLADVSTVVPNDGQHLVWNATTSLWTPSASGAGGGGYQDSDARNAISVAGDLTYNSTTGVMSYTTPTDTDTTYTAGSGLTLTGTVFSNTAPDQTVALTGSGATSITGTYPNFTITSTDTNTDTDTTYTAGTNVSIDGSNVISSTDTNTTYTSSDFTHNSLSGVGANEHIDWTTDQGSTNIHPSNYTDTDTNTTYTAGTGLTLTGTVFSMTASHFDGAFSSLSGVAAVTASDDDKVLYYDHSTTSFKWKAGGTPAGYNNTNWDTAFGWGDHSTAGYLTSTTAHYTDSDVNTHLNTGTATANQALVWTGTDYDWVTSTDSDTTYTAGSGLTLAGTVFSNTSPDQTVVLTGTGATSITGTYPNFTINSTDTNTDTNTTYTAGSGLTLTGTAFSLSAAHFDGAYASLTGAPTMYANSNVDGHLNTSTATANQVLTWTGTDYDWISSGAHFDGNYSSLVGAPTTVSSFTNDAGYLTSETDSQTLSLSGTTLAITGGNNVDLSSLTIDDMADVNITSVADNQFLKYDNASGDWLNETVTIPTLTSQLTNDAGFLTSETAHYADADVDLHINKSTATGGQVLTWTGTDYSWTSVAGSYTDADARAAISGTTGLSYNSTTGVMTLNASMDTLLDVNSTGATLGQVLKWNGTAWAPALDIDTTYTAGANVGISGGGVISATDTNTTYVNTDWDHDALTNFVANEHIDWTQSGAGTIHASNYTDTNTDTTYTAGANVSISGSNVISATDTNTTYTAGTNVTITAGAINATDTNTTYVNTDWNHDLLTGFVANEHIDWTTDQGATNIHAGNYTDTDTVYTSFNTDFDTRLASNGYANSDVDSHLNTSGASSSEVLSWNGSDYAWVTNTGSGATDKIEEGNSSVEVIDGGTNGHIMFNTNGTDCWSISGHILPEAHETYDIGSADKKVRHLFLSDNSLKMGDNLNTIKTSGTNLLFNDDDVMDYDNLKNTPDTVSSGTGIQVNAGVVSINASLDLLSNVSATAPATGEVLKWNGSAWAPAVDLTSGSSAMNDLSDVDTTGISTGQYLKWDGSSFVASTVTAGASSIDALTDVDTTTSAPNNGDVLTWVTADSEWAPAAPASGGSGGTTVEYFKINYDSAGLLTSITNTTSGVSATILSASGGDTEITFSGYSYPPAGILIYGYARASNEYVIQPLNKDIGTRKIAGGGTTDNPVAFGSMGSLDMTIKLRETDVGASRQFASGVGTHAWIMFTMV